MSAARSNKSHALAWTLSIIAVPVLYVLTLPPIFFFAHAHCSSSWKFTDFMNSYGAPYRWLADQKSLQRPLVAYAQFWETMFDYPPPNP